MPAHIWPLFSDEQIKLGSVEELAAQAVCDITDEASEDPEMENTTYNGWKSGHFINNVLVFASDGKSLLLLISFALLPIDLKCKT